MKIAAYTDGEAENSASPNKDKLSFRKLVWREIYHDRIAYLSFYILLFILTITIVVPFFIDVEAISRINLSLIYEPPSLNHWLGTDKGGRDVFAYLIIGARNSITIGVAITCITGFIGLTVGLIAGYFGGTVDFVIMRILDFLMVLPTLMFIIVFVVIVPDFNIWAFIAIMSMLLWFGKARLIRSKALAERELDYINASKTVGTPHWKIIVFQLLPNLSSIIIVNMTLTLAGNIGIETGLTFLGFGLPESTPSLGTLISYARNPDVMENKWWVWLPAALLILVVMLCINFLGQAVKRAADARQRVV